MKLHKIALAVFLGAASMAASAADNTTTEKESPQWLRILRPKVGEVISGKTTVNALLNMGDAIPRKSLRVTLNGKDLTSGLRRGVCERAACYWTVELTGDVGLRDGDNRLLAFALTPDHSTKTAQTDFNYDYGLQGGQNLPNWISPSVGLSLNPGGAQPWVTLTTGFPAGVQDNLDPTQYRLPSRDTTFPTANETACTSRYQVVVLNRVNPAQEDGYMCPADAGTLKSDLAGLTKGTEIVLVGTTQYNNADTDLDTTGIGGTNYSSYPSASQPQGYAAIGVSGAAPGSAYESYYIASDVGKAYQTNPFANGLLAKDQYANYNFHAGNLVQFEVYPNNPLYGTSSVFTSSSPAQFAWLPPLGSSNGFWLLTLDRVTLLPIDLTQGETSCNPQAGICGQFFQTSNPDANTAAQIADALGSALALATSRQLLVLTTIGQPFQPGTDPGVLAENLTYLGGSGYTLRSLTGYNSTYTFVAPGINSLVPPQPVSPFSNGVVNSSSAFSQQGQTGIVRGVMAPDNNNLYFPAVASQEDGKKNGDGATSLSVNYDFYSISSQMPIDWSLNDTAGHVAAYHWASQQFLGYYYPQPPNSPIDPLSADLRSWYTSPSRNSDMATHFNDFHCPSSNSPVCNYPSDAPGFTEQDLADVDAELYQELAALHETDLYLGDGADAIGGLIKSSNNSVSSQVINATYEVLNNQVMPVTISTSVSASSFDWMNLLAGVTSIAAAGLGPLDIPAVAAAVGVTSGALWTGSAMAPWATNDPATPPNYESAYDTTLGQLSESATTYSENLQASYDTSLDNIYSDWGRLSATWAKTSNSASGWYFDSYVTADRVGGILQGGVSRSLYSQLLSKFYNLDSYTQQPVTTLDKIGMFYAYFNNFDGAYFTQCNASYSSSVLSNTNLYRIFPTPGGATLTDMFVLGGSIAYQGTKSESESFPSDSLQGILFGSDDGDLNISPGLVYGTHLLPWRTGGPSMGTYGGVNQCYKPGCKDNVLPEPQGSTCIAP